MYIDLCQKCHLKPNTIGLVKCIKIGEKSPFFGLRFTEYRVFWRKFNKWQKSNQFAIGFSLYLPKYGVKMALFQEVPLFTLDLGKGTVWAKMTRNMSNCHKILILRPFVPKSGLFWAKIKIIEIIEIFEHFFKNNW